MIFLFSLFLTFNSSAYSITFHPFPASLWFKPLSPSWWWKVRASHCFPCLYSYIGTVQRAAFCKWSTTYPNGLLSREIRPKLFYLNSKNLVSIAHKWFLIISLWYIVSHILKIDWKEMSLYKEAWSWTPGATAFRLRIHRDRIASSVWALVEVKTL